MYYACRSVDLTNWHSQVKALYPKVVGFYHSCDNRWLEIWDSWKSEGRKRPLFHVLNYLEEQYLGLASNRQPALHKEAHKVIVGVEKKESPKVDEVLK